MGVRSGGEVAGCFKGEQRQEVSKAVSDNDSPKLIVPLIVKKVHHLFLLLHL